MVWTVDKYGLAEDLSKVPACELERCFPDGRGLYATLTGAAKGEGIALTAFTKPLAAVPYYDALEAMDARLEGHDFSTLTPVSIRTGYRVEFFDGEIRHPPLHPSDVQKLGYAKMLEETGLFEAEDGHELQGEALVDEAIRQRAECKHDEDPSP